MLPFEMSMEEERPLSSSSIFFASITDRYCLNPLSEKKTYHVALNLAASLTDYNVGDCLGIYPQNDPELVEMILQRGNFSGHEMVLNRKKESLPFRQFLLTSVNLHRIPRKLGGNSFLSVIEKLPFSLQEMCDLFLPMLPRYYSIASSSSVVNKEAHLTISLTVHDEKNSLAKNGICSWYICHIAPCEQACIPVFLQPSRHFFLPPESFNKPIIMIGPGTGVAPFRAFMQERHFRNASRENWLFFGERHQALDFYYKEFWESLEKNNFLKLNTAFSRDQESKIYVQHRMQENSKTVFEWLQRGAYLYVCGDAKRVFGKFFVIDSSLLPFLSPLEIYSQYNQF